MYKGMVEKDETVLRKVLAPSFTLVHMTGMRQTLDVFIRSVLDGTLNYSLPIHQRIETKITNGQAQLIGESLVRASVFGGGWNTWRLKLSCQLVENNGNWQITEARASTY